MAKPQKVAESAPVTVESAAASGDRRAALEAMRQKLARDLDEAPPAVAAQIAGQLRQVLADLAGMPSTERTGLDELRAKRAARLAAADVPAPAKRQTRQRRA